MTVSGYPLSLAIDKGEAEMIDRSAVARALAKAIAYKMCGKDREAETWARELIVLLQCANILREA